MSRRPSNWLEVMLLAGYTAIPEAVQRLAQWIRRIQPDKVQLNTAVRPPAEHYAMAVPPGRLDEFARMFDPRGEVIAEYRGRRIRAEAQGSVEAVLTLLQRRPCTLDDVARGLNLKHSEAVKCVLYSVDFADIEALQREGRWEEAAQCLVAAAQGLQRAGAEVVVLCTNTMHKLAETIQAGLRVPFLHVADATAQQIERAGVRRVGLLGTRFIFIGGLARDQILTLGGIHGPWYDPLRMTWQRRMGAKRWLVGGNDIHPGEGRAVLTAGLLFFLLLTCLMVLRPAREALGLARGVEGVRRLFLVTVVCTLPLVPLFGWLVSRCSRRRLVGLSLRICALILLCFYAGLTLLPESLRSLVAGSYYVFHSVFNLFVVSIFWAFMADYFKLTESIRLFPAITLGGSLGAILGSLISWQLAEFVGVSALFLLAAALLELAV